MVNPKSRSEIALMRRAGQVVAEVHQDMKELVRPGVSTWDLDAHAEKLIRAAGGLPTFKGYNGFPASLCTSINQEVVHGIPSRRRKLQAGDIIGIDCGVTLEGYVGDSAWTYCVGEVRPEVLALLHATEESLWRGIAAAQVGARLHDIGASVEAVIKPLGYGIVRDFCGHGVGTALHEDPQVPNYGEFNRGPRMRSGWCLAIEPMINLGTARTRILADGWTVVTQDGKPSAHFEHSIALTDDGPIILTALTDALAYRFHRMGAASGVPAQQAAAE